MNELELLIKRFQSLKEITGTNKTSSYSVGIFFDPWNDTVAIELGGYDIPNWSRHEYIKTTRKNLLKDLEEKIIQAEQDVEQGKPYE